MRTSHFVFIYINIIFLTAHINEPIHHCNHDISTQPTTTIPLEYDNHPYETASSSSPRRLIDASNASPIRIGVYYDTKTISTSNGLTTTQINYIKQITSAAVRFYSSFIRVIPVTGSISYDPCASYQQSNGHKYCTHYFPTCNQIIIPDEFKSKTSGVLFYCPDETKSTYVFTGGNGITGNDLIIYITYDNTTPSCQNNNVAAHAGACQRDQYGRPIFGALNICSKTISEQKWKTDVLIMTHEIGHILIMSTDSWSEFSDTNGNKIPKNLILDTTDIRGDGKPYIISNKVKETARLHFNCDTLEGAPLEGTISGVHSHWDEHYLQSENLGALLFNSQQYVSIFTFALMGKNAGCKWFTNTCINI
eukprot:215617_1